jgi:putative addiction module antidote
MNKPLKITKIGNSAGIVLPKEVLAHLDRKVGDELTLVLKPNGIELVGGEPDFEEQMAAARKVMADTRHVLLSGDGAEKFADVAGVEREA